MSHQLIKLTPQFFADHEHLVEIEKKVDRPYNMFLFEIEGNKIAIPFRSNIIHPHAIWTNKSLKCGLDLSKAIIVSDEKYISDKRAALRKDEFKVYNEKKHTIEHKFIKYLDNYKKALLNPENSINSKLLGFSTLQNYHDEFNIKL